MRLYCVVSEQDVVWSMLRYARGQLRYGLGRAGYSGGAFPIRCHPNTCSGTWKTLP
ncbi:hypothetical protein BD310DRAFT_922654 [Dichomitus squalens]|uniref:Uncharacterized protein n=1 Tax=Dichomitus squalens TaxID=114155 RepID=A0A4Q9Q089_9APHY|nr:hypothetical protein BD310DRAFT_922654 [Dichomitus squalens]